MIAPEIRHRTCWFRAPFRVEQCLIVFTVIIDNAAELKLRLAYLSMAAWRFLWLFPAGRQKAMPKTTRPHKLMPVM